MAPLKVHWDWETYSELNLKTVGMFRYAEHPSTEPLIAAYSIGNGPVIGVDLTMEWDMIIRMLSPAFDALDRGAVLAAHNAQFERVIWEKTRFGRMLPYCPSEHQWDCTAARARMLALPGSLDGAANALGVSTRKDPRGTALINMFSKPQSKKSKGVVNTWRIRPEDRPDDFEDFIRYCENDVVVEKEIDKILPPLTSVEQEAYALDYRINDRGMPVNLHLVERAADFVEEYSDRLQKRSVEISGYRPTQREKTLAYLESRGFPLPNLQAATVEKLAKRKGLPPDLVELLDQRIELSRAGTKKLKAIKDTVSPDGRIRGGFLFSAASTRRWSSTGVQMHNLQKPEGEVNPELVLRMLAVDPMLLCDLFERPLTALAQSIRGFFEAPDDKVFHIADYSSVEPRGLAWVAGEQWILDAYHRKDDLYRITAGKVYGLNPAGLTKDGPERFMGKQLVLGCGYGMGPPRFIETVARFGTLLTEEESRKAVYGYRESVPAITQFWRTINAACIKATREWKTVRVGKLVFRPETLSNGYRVLFIDMPSGSIAYPDPGVGSEMWNGMPNSTFEFMTPLGSQWVRTDTFGGSLTENVVQAMCRDVLRDGLVSADKAGFKVIGHVHDEGIAEGEDNPDDLREFERHLTQSSPWAKGFPLETEGFNAKRYRK